MDEVVARTFLPKIKNKRVSTQGNKYNIIKNHRFSLILPEKPNQYIKSYNARNKDRQKMVSLYYDNQFSCKLLQADPKLQHTVKEMKEKQQKSKTMQLKTLKGTDNEEQNLRSGSQNKLTFNNALLSDVENFYLQEIKPKKINQKALPMFIQLLQVNNNVLKKISPIILQSLLKLGFITRYEPGDCIYREGSPICNIGIILWGQCALKKRNSKFRFSCYPGYGLGQEILFQKITHIQARSSNIEKGRFMTYEKCKSVSSCGILFIGEKQYGWMSQKLTLQGLKQLMSKFESLLLRSYLKKREKRLFFG